jgi:hypothetical protein
MGRKSIMFQKYASFTLYVQATQVPTPALRTYAIPNTDTGKGNAVDFWKVKPRCVNYRSKSNSKVKKNAVNHVRVESAGGVW